MSKGINKDGVNKQVQKQDSESNPANVNTNNTNKGEGQVKATQPALNNGTADGGTGNTNFAGTQAPAPNYGGGVGTRDTSADYVGRGDGGTNTTAPGERTPEEIKQVEKENKDA